MSCCGNKREELRQRHIVSVLPTPPPPAPLNARTAVVFTGTGSYLVTGSYTRGVYHFSSDRPEQFVDPEDAKVLLTTGLFQQTAGAELAIDR